MKHISFFCSQFGGGGAEMHLLRIINAADFSRYKITLILLRDRGNYESRLNPKVEVRHLSKGVSSSTSSLLAAYYKLPRLVNSLRPDVVLSFMDRQNVVLALLRKAVNSDIKFILCCQNSLTNNLSQDGIMGRWNKFWIPRLYPKADLVIAICKGVARDLTTNFAVPEEKVKVIYNAGYDPEIVAQTSDLRDSELTGDYFNFLAVGRLARQKGFDILLNALAKIKDSNFKLTILGKGPDKEQLIRQRDELGLAGKVEFAGFVSNPYDYYRTADLFVLSSRWEGFGNVVTEAMACGAAVLTTNCPFGPDEIVRHEKDGYIVDADSADALAAGMIVLMENPALRKRLSVNAIGRARDFLPVSISEQYFNRIEEVCSRPKAR
jgi:glycosyltransferase involved in cell wall biosynthesis